MPYHLQTVLLPYHCKSGNITSWGFDVCNCVTVLLSYGFLLKVFLLSLLVVAVAKGFWPVSHFFVEKKEELSQKVLIFDSCPSARLYSWILPQARERRPAWDSHPQPSGQRGAEPQRHANPALLDLTRAAVPEQIR